MKLKKSKYNVGDAVEYLNAQNLKRETQIKVDLFFLKKEVEEIKYDLIGKEKKIEDLENELAGIIDTDSEYHKNLVENKIKELINTFLDKYNNSGFYDDLTLEESIDFARKGLAPRANSLGLKFDELKKRILEESE